MLGKSVRNAIQRSIVAALEFIRGRKWRFMIGATLVIALVPVSMILVRMYSAGQAKDRTYILRLMRILNG